MLLPKSYAGSLQVALSTQTTTHTAQQPLNGLRTALKKISRSVNAAFSAVPVAPPKQPRPPNAALRNLMSWTGCRLLLPKVPELRRLPPPAKAAALQRSKPQMPNRHSQVRRLY